MNPATIRIIGVGNPLMGDDGIGITIIERLQQETLPEQVELIDGGCGGLTLLDYFEDCRQLIIVDAADFGAPAGSLKIMAAPELQRLPSPSPGLTTHQPGLREVLMLAEQLGNLPRITLCLIQIESCQPAASLSQKVSSAIEELVAELHKILAEWD